MHSASKNFVLHSITNTVIYLEEYSVHLIYRITHYKCHEIEPWEQDIFNMEKTSRNQVLIILETIRTTINRAAENSNFLHPVIYFFDGRMLSGEFMILRVLHVVEDFTTVFDGPNLHRRPPKEFVEEQLGIVIKDPP
uniref:Uncharacterized protein n=1 Tax=Romanomermis culicivorax TaxID=13658 RepID=A0A915IGT5_ROMCU